MSTFDYILDSGLVLLVLIQIKERRLTSRELIRPLILVGIAVINYLHGIPTGGNDLALIGAFALLGGLIGTASGRSVILRRREDGEITARAGWASAIYWVLGMGSRFGFILWMTHGGESTIAQFSAHHAITSGEAWTVALLAWAVAEVLGRTLTLAIRRSSLQPAAELRLAA